MEKAGAQRADTNSDHTQNILHLTYGDHIQQSMGYEAAMHARAGPNSSSN